MTYATLLATQSAPPAPTTGLQDPATMVLLAVGLLGIIYYAFLRPKARNAKRRDPLATPPSQRQSLASERSAERQMQSLVIELEQLSRRMGSQIDTKAAKLSALIDQAERATSELNAVLAKAKAIDLTDAITNGQSGPADSGLAGLSHHRDIYTLADAGKSIGDIARQTNRPAGEIELILALRGS